MPVLLLILLLLLPVLPARAGEPYQFRSIGVEDGLSQNMVYCILQDRQGYMWFGTQDGINRYDGTSFKIFRENKISGLGNDAIISLAESPDGSLWAGTVQGLYCYSPSAGAFREIHIPRSLIRDLLIEDDGTVWAAAADTCLYRIGPGERLTTYNIAQPGRGTRIRSLCQDRDGNIWMATYGSGLVRLRTATGDTEHYPYGDVNLTKVIPLDSETLLVGTMTDGVLSFDLRTLSFSAYEGLEGDKVRFVHDILPDDRNRIWVGAEDGLHVGKNNGVTHLKHIPGNPYSLSDNAVFSITQDREGSIWIGTYFGGVNYWSEYSSQFKNHFPVPGSNQLEGKSISEFYEDPDGTLWIGTEDAGLHRYDPVEDRYENGFLPAGNIHAVTMLDGRLWVGSYGDGLFILDTKTRQYTRHIASEREGALHNNNIYAIFRDREGVTWIGTEQCLYQYVDGRFTAIIPELLNGQVNDIWQDFDGNLWVVSYGQGVFLRDALSGVWSHPRMCIGDETEDNFFLTCILEDRNHDLWFGTDNAGVFFYDHKARRFQRQLTEDFGLPNNMVYKLLEDPSGAIWGSTNHGIFCIRDKQILSYDHHSGLVSDQFNFKSGILTRDGTLYFGGVKGFVSFRPDDLRWSEGPSNIVFNRFLVFNQEIAPASPLVLKHRESVFSIGFADLSYASAGIKTYQYRLTGKRTGKQWVNLEDRRLLTWSNLPPGHYRLEVRAARPEAEHPEAPFGMDIQILPPFYRTVWAYLVYALLALGAFALLARTVYLKIKAHNARLLEEMERLKEQEQKTLRKADTVFLSKITSYTHAHMDNPDLDVNDLAEAMCISRASLYRKMKEVTDLSPNEFIRMCRLEKAAQLLKSGEYQVKEVAFAVGFSSTSYFTKTFQKEFGVSPKAYSKDPS